MKFPLLKRTEPGRGGPDRRAAAYPAHLVVLVLCLILLSVPRPACAHVTADNMPDSLAEMEYTIYLEFKPNDTKVLNKLGMVYYRLGKLDKSYDTFTRILKLEPENFDALDGIGLVLAARSRYDEALTFHRRAIAINPDDMAGYYHLGVVLEKLGRPEEALQAFRTARTKFQEQYPQGSDNRKTAAFGDEIRTACERVSARLKKK